MRTRKLRLLSALLAVAMMFMLTPTAAFADDNGTALLQTLKIVNGKPDVSDTSVISYHQADSTDTSSYYYHHLGENDRDRDWAWRPSDDFLFLFKGTYSGAEEQEITSFVQVRSGVTLTGGIYSRVYNGAGGVIENGIYREVVGSSTTANYGTIKGGIFAKKPINNNVDGTLRHLSASDCTINGVISDEAYVVGAQQITLTADARTFKEWKVEGVDVDTTPVVENKKVILNFTMPTDCDVTIEIEKKKISLTDVEIKDDVPVYDGEEYLGSNYDGWEYNKDKQVLTVLDGASVNLDAKTIEWGVWNYGDFENGVVKGGFINYKTVKDATFGGNFYNREDENGNEGRVESGVFAHQANFGTQNPALTWLNVKGGKVNDAITGMASVVGQQKVTVTATVSPFEGWVYSGEVSDAVAKQIEEQKNKETMTLELDGEAEDSIVLTAKTDGEAFALTMLDGKASVNGTNVTAAVPGQTVTLTLDDSEIPEGMSFDHWVISPDVELEGDFKATDRTTSFTMPAQELTIYASLRTDSDDGMDMATVVAGVAVGAGVAYLGYQVGTELYAEQILGKGVAIPRTRADVALTAWQLAGKPEVAIEGEPLSEAAMAQKWAVESGLMQNDADGSFNPDKKMSKLKALKVLDAAKKMG